MLIPNPGYPTYRSAATIAGGVCVDYLLREQNAGCPISLRSNAVGSTA
ncbi:MAG: hypothetical protein ACLR8Y_16660 [Alistipes indistinctus]